jgi:hypothetical protein
VTHDEVPIHEAGDLARRHAVHRLRERDNGLARITVHLDRALPPRRVRAKPDPIDTLGPAMESGAADSDAVGCELVSAAGGDAIRGGVGRQHEKWLAAADTQPTALADREVVMAVVLA